MEYTALLHLSHHIGCWYFTYIVPVARSVAPFKIVSLSFRGEACTFFSASMSPRRPNREVRSAHASLRQGDWCLSSNSLPEGYTLDQAMTAMWMLNVAVHPPVTPTRGCPILPRGLPIAQPQGLVVLRNPASDSFHQGVLSSAESSGNSQHCPFRESNQKRET